MEDNQNIICKGNANCGFSFGVIELYTDKLVFTSNKGKTTIYEYNTITNVRDTMGCLEVTTTTGKVESFAIDKELRLQIFNYISNIPIIKENNNKVQQTNIENKTIPKEEQMNFKDIPSDIKNFKNLNEDKKNMYIGLGALLVIAIVVIMIINGIFGGSISSSSKQKSYIKEAVENLSSASTAPITSLNSAKIIKYGDDVLVAISYMQTDIYGSSSSYSSTYSTKQKRYLNNNELENMMFGEEWENAEIVQVDSDIIYELNKKFK